MMLRLYDHPLSPYAQKVKIALREKGQAFEALMPQGIGAGGAAGEFIEDNPRGEVPYLIDGNVHIFDSTIILEYIEDKWPQPALLPTSPADRARVRMLGFIEILSGCQGWRKCRARKLSTAALKRGGSSAQPK